MSSSNDINAWLIRCRYNIRQFKRAEVGKTREEQLAFIRNQYTILSVTQKVIDGTARFQGLSR